MIFWFSVSPMNIFPIAIKLNHYCHILKTNQALHSTWQYVVFLVSSTITDPWFVIPFLSLPSLLNTYSPPVYHVYIVNWANRRRLKYMDTVTAIYFILKQLIINILEDKKLHNLKSLDTWLYIYCVMCDIANHLVILVIKHLFSYLRN